MIGASGLLLGNHAFIGLVCIYPIPIERDPDSRPVRRPDVAVLIDAVQIAVEVLIYRSLRRLDLGIHKSELIEIGVSNGRHHVPIDWTRTVEFHVQAKTFRRRAIFNAPVIPPSSCAPHLT